MGDVIEKGNWFRMGTAVFVVCPGCKTRMPLEHTISAKGVVTPSLDCPRCVYHESNVVLEGWVP